MTENEARKKWCPFVRYGNEAGCNRNSMPDGCDSPVHCIASDCACWVDNMEVLGEPEYEPGGHCGLINR